MWWEEHASRRPELRRFVGNKIAEYEEKRRSDLEAKGDALKVKHPQPSFIIMSVCLHAATVREPSLIR